MLRALTQPNRRPAITLRTDYSRIGRIQRQIRRLLIIHGPMTSGELARRLYPRPNKDWHWRQVRDSASRFAERIGNVRSPGRPVLWRLK